MGFDVDAGAQVEALVRDGVEAHARWRLRSEGGLVVVGATKKASVRAAKVPAALARRAEKAADAKIARILAQAKQDIDLIARRRGEITEAFYDIGEALVRLKRREVVAALGCRSFAELCAEHVGISSSQADRLVDIVTNMTRAEAIDVGATKAASLVALARATPEDDTVSDLLRHGARVGGKQVDVRKASSRQVARATAAARAARPNGKTDARSVTKDERATCEALEKALRQAGAKDATVQSKRGSHGGRATIELPIADITRLATAVRVVRAR